MELYIASGVTSNLFASLLPFLLSSYKIYASVRSSSNKERIDILEKLGIKIISFEEGLLLSDNIRILWLSTHDEPLKLEKLSQKGHTLAIASGAIMDFFLGKQKEEELNSYQKSKLSLCRVPGLSIFIPGFYIEDMNVPKWASKGLHGDTTPKLFGYDFYSEENFDWTKTYSVTPKSKIVCSIIEWLNHPQTFPINQPIIVCSDRQFRRWELRQMVPNVELFNTKVENKIKLFPPLNEKIYLNFHHATDSKGDSIYITDKNVKDACILASNLIKNKEI